MPSQAVLHYYRQFRAHDGEPLYPPALAAWNSARRFIHFRADLSKTVEASKKRSHAAKKAWKARRARRARLPA
jgi:hypothetical protein